MTIQPSSLESEKAVIGGCLLSGSITADIMQTLVPSDFCSGSHRTLFARIVECHAAGEPVEPQLIAEQCKSVTDVTSVISDCIVAHASTQSTLAHARNIASLAATRRIEELASRTLGMIQGDNIHDPALLLDGLRSDLEHIELPGDTRPIDGLWVAADLIGTDFPEPPWIAYGLLRETWRMLLVGVEGGGKSTMLRQIATGIACGEHPFTFQDIEEKPALIIDCENPESVVRDGLRMMESKVLDANLTILARPGGLNIRDRRDRDLLHRVFATVQPKVACIGPLYKLYRQEKGEPDEQAAVAAQNILDELRVTYGCALVLETHAPKGSAAFRELIPFGSSAWMRWPELGWKLIPCDRRGDPTTEGDSIKLGRFRGDRVKVEIPKRFDRDAASDWPWCPTWPGPIPKASAA